MPSMKAITSKKDLYLTDKITIKIISSPHCQSSNDMQSLCINPDLIFDSNEIFMSESLKRPLYKLEMSEELNVRDIFNEENLFKFLSKTFMKNYLFYNIDKEGIEGILAYIFLKKFNKGSIILSEGEIPFNFFIVQSGIVLKKSIKNGVQVTEYLDKGKIFGEKSLFNQTKRTCSYIAEGNCLLWGMNKATLFKLLTMNNMENIEENKKIINMTILKGTDANKRHLIALNMYEQRFGKGEVILDIGSLCACCFLVKKGELHLKSVDRKTIEKRYLPGELIGDWSLNSFFFQNYLEASKKEDVQLLVISNKKLRNILGDNLYSLNLKNLSRFALKQSQIFSKLSIENMEKIINNLEISTYQKNQVVCKQGSQIDSLYIPLDCNLRKINYFL